MRNLSFILASCLLLWSIILDARSSSSYFPQNEYYILQDLFNNTLGESWNWRVPYETYGNPWNFRGPLSTNPCVELWQGILCSNNCTTQICTILQLHLNSYNLQRKLPISLTGLVNVEELDFDNNYLTGTIPTQFGSFKSLRTLSMANNKFMGSLPTQLSSLTFLEKLSLSQNQLNGSIPGSLSALTRLNYFSVADNVQLVGSIPDSFQTWTNILFFSVATCSLTGVLPHSLESWINITTFDASSNKFYGTIPASFSSWKAIETMDLSNNAFTGSIPTFVTNFEHIIDLVLYDNKFNGSIPQNWSISTHLETFLCSGNFLTGKIPRQLFSIPSLVSVAMSNNFLSRSLPHGDFRLPNLTSFATYNNLLTGTLPEWLFLQENVNFLDFSNNAFHGSLPDVLPVNSLLYEFNGENNFLTGSIPSFMNASLLFQVQLTNNQIGGSVSPQLVHNSHLAVLNVGTNYLTGPIPQNFGHWRSMFTLNLSTNHINGTLPSTFLDGGNLVNLYLQENHISGSIAELNFSASAQLATIEIYFNMFMGHMPPSVCNMSGLSIFLLFANQFTGTIPHCLSFLPQLRQFSVANNFFHGNISTFLVNMPVILSIDISHNMLTGNIAPSLKELQTLVLLDLCRNSFSGSVPADLNASSLRLLFVNGNQLEGSIPVSLRTIKTLLYLNLSTNYFHGDTSHFIAPYSSLGFINLAMNYFSGTINQVFNTLANLFVLAVQGNFFTGPINALIDPSRQVSVIKIDISSNSLTGGLPGEIFRAPNLESFVAASNCITGSIPMEACLAGNVTTLVLDGLHASPTCNRRIFSFGDSSVYILSSGVHLPSIPSCLLAMPKLQLLHMSGNAIPKQLGNDINVSASLIELDLSHNALTGTIPLSIFRHFFTSLDLSFNQFNGTIDDRIVVSKANVTVEVKGAETLSPMSYTSLKLQVNRLSGSIPLSVCALPEVNILDGNMFSCDGGNEDHLPSNDPKYASYTCGSDLTNAILISWLCMVMGFMLILAIIFRCTLKTSLLVAYQQVQETIYFTSTTVVNAVLLDNQTDDHHHSWKLGEQAEAAASGEEEVVSPVHSFTNTGDKNEDSVAQEEEETDEETDNRVLNPLFVPTLSLAPAFLGHNRGASLSDHTSLRLFPTLPNILRSTTRKSASTASTNTSSSHITVSNHLYLFTLENQLFRKFLLMICGYVSTVLAIAYISLKVDYGTYTYQYVWNVSFTYLKGKIATSTLYVLIVLLLFVMHYVARFHLFAKHKADNRLTVVGSTEISAQLLSRKFSIRHLWLATIFLVNCAVVLVVNGSYVYAVSENHDRHVLEFISVLIGLFKLVWSNVVVLGYIEQVSVDLLSTTRQSLFLVVISIFNSIIAPYAAEAFVSSNCFQYVITAPPQDTSTFTSDACYLYSSSVISNITVECGSSAVQYELLISSLSSAVSTVSFNPPFIYSFQCSSTLVTLFADVFIIRYLLSGVILPPLMVLLKLCQRYCLEKYGVGSWYFRKITSLVPMLFRPIAPLVVTRRFSTTNAKKAEARMHMFQLTNDAIVLYIQRQRLVLRKSFAVRMISDLAVLLTFGVIFPPLALVVTFSMTMEMFMIEYGLGRIAQLAVYDPRPHAQLKKFLRALNDSFRGFGDGIWRIFPVLSVFCAMFWSFSFYDTLGNEEGAVPAVWVIPVTIVLPIFIERILYVWFKLYFYCTKCTSHARSTERDPSKDIEARGVESVELSTISKE